MYCSRCGKENDDNTKFCKSCGAKLPKPDVSESQLLSQENLTAQDEEGSSAVKGKKKNWLLVLLCLLLACCVVGAAGILVFLSTNENKQFRKKMAEGERYLEELDYVQAETAYLDAIEIDPKKKEPYMLLADIHVMQEDYDKAIAIAEEGRDAVPEKDKPEFESLIEDLVEESKNYEDGQPENDKESTEGENKAEVPESAENQYKDFTIGKMAVENGSWFAERLENTLTIYKDGKPVKIVNGDFEGEYGINATMVMNADGVFFVQEDTIQFYNFETGEVEELISDGLQPEVIGTIGNKLYYTMNDSGYEESDNMVICEYDFAAKKSRVYELPGVCQHSTAAVVNRQLFYNSGAGDISPVELYRVDTESGMALLIQEDVNSGWTGFQDKLYYVKESDCMQSDMGNWTVEQVEYDISTQTTRNLFSGKYRDLGHIDFVTENYIYVAGYDKNLAINKETMEQKTLFTAEERLDFKGKDQDNLYFSYGSILYPESVKLIRINC